MWWRRYLMENPSPFCCFVSIIKSKILRREKISITKQTTGRILKNLLQDWSQEEVAVAWQAHKCEDEANIHYYDPWNKNVALFKLFPYHFISTISWKVYTFPLILFTSLFALCFLFSSGFRSCFVVKSQPVDGIINRTKNEIEWIRDRAKSEVKERKYARN